MDSTLRYAHGTVMTLAWMVFGSTGVLFARYGRVVRFGRRRQLLGKAVWFQTHRFLLSLASLATLLGFFLILVFTGGRWVNLNSNTQRLFAHSVLGGIVVCCVIVQVWLALYRCHPHSRFRFIFDWSHRVIGSFTFVLSVATIFLITFVLRKYRSGLITIVSLWTGWLIIIVILFEIIQYQYRAAAALMTVNSRVGNNNNQEQINTNAPPDIEAGTNPTVENRRLNKVKQLLLLIHIVVSIVLCISFIVLIWNQN